MPKDRTKFISGISDLVVVAGRVKSGDGDVTFVPSEVGGFPMIHAGFIGDEQVQVKTSPSSLREISGAELQQSDAFEIRASSLETHPTHLALLEKFARLPNRTLWYLRKFAPQLGETSAIKIGDLGLLVEIEQHLHTRGTSLVSVIGQKYSDGAQGYTAGEGIPRADLVTSDAYYVGVKKYVDLVRTTRRRQLVLSLAPDIYGIGLHKAALDKFYDESDNRYVGTLSGGPVWGEATGPYLRFDGANDHVDFGNILNDDGASDRLIECWVRIQAANGTTVRLLGKKSDVTNSTAGWALYRHAGNTLTFVLADGTGLTGISNNTTTLQNVWRHFAIAIDRNGNATPYLNGVADGVANSVAARASGTNALSFRLGRDEAVYGQADHGRFRVYDFGAGGLPSNIADIVASHFNTSKAIYGL